MKITKISNYFWKNKNNLIFFEAIIIAFISTLFYTNKYVIYLFAMLQCLVLLFCLFKQNWVDYYGHYILYVGTSIEFGVLLNVEKFYSFKEIRFFGINLGIWILLPLLFIFLLDSFPIGRLRRRNRKAYNFIILYLITFLSATVIGIFHYVINDNDIRNLTNWKSIFLDQFYLRGLQPILMILVLTYILCKCNKIEDLEIYLTNSMICEVLCMSVSVISGQSGNYAGIRTLVVGNSIRWIPILFILPLYKEYEKRRSIWLWAALGMILTLLYNPTGKTILVYALIPLLYIIIAVKRNKSNLILLWCMAMPALAVLSIYAISYLIKNSHLFYVKYKQAVSLLSYIFGSTRMESVSDSPRVRIYEILSILTEYINKPWNAFLGKGLGGSAFNYFNLSYVGNAFSDEEWGKNLFCSVHETLAKLLLSNGLLGLIFFVNTVFNCIKGMFSSPWILLGLYWFVVCFSHSTTMTAIGLSALLYGLIQVDNKNEKSRYYYLSKN